MTPFFINIQMRFVSYRSLLLCTVHAWIIIWFHTVLPVFSKRKLSGTMSKKALFSATVQLICHKIVHYIIIWTNNIHIWWFFDWLTALQFHLPYDSVCCITAYIFMWRLFCELYAATKCKQTLPADPTEFLHDGWLYEILWILNKRWS